MKNSDQMPKTPRVAIIRRFTKFREVGFAQIGEAVLLIKAFVNDYERECTLKKMIRWA